MSLRTRRHTVVPVVPSRRLATRMRADGLPLPQRPGQAQEPPVDTGRNLEEIVALEVGRTLKRRPTAG